MYPLRLLKVMRAAVPIVASRPPLGASGLTYSKCLKSAGYFRSPKAESPCLGSAVATVHPATMTAKAAVARTAPANLAIASIARTRGPRRFGGIPPGVGAPRSVRWSFIRQAEPVPSRSPRSVGIPLGDDEMMPQEHPVQRPGGRDQFLATLGVDHPVDQLVDGRVGNAGEVAAAGTVGRRGAPEVALFVARR